MPEMSDLKPLIEKQGEAFNEFKSVNDARLAALEKGQGTAELEAKLTSIEKSMSAIEAEGKAMMTALELKLNRQAFQSGEAGTADQQQEVKSFNLAAKAFAKGHNRPIPDDVEAKQYLEYKGAFRKLLRSGGGQHSTFSSDEIKALSVGSDPSGGYLAPSTIESVIDRTVGTVSAMRGAARVIKIGTREYEKLVSVGGTDSGWLGENESPTITATPDLKMIKIPANTQFAQPQSTTQMMEDSTLDIENWLGEEVGIKFTEKEGDAFINGDGVKKPFGLLQYPVIGNENWSWGKLGFVKSGAASNFAASAPSDKLIDLAHSVKSQYRVGSKWMLNSMTLGAVRKFKDGMGNYLWVPGLQDGAVGQLLGYQVVPDDNMPDITANAFPIAFGNFDRGYLIVDRRGVVILVDRYTSKPNVLFFCTRRVGGGVQNFEAIKLLKITA